MAKPGLSRSKQSKSDIEDVAEMIIFLASEKAYWLAGQLLHIGGVYRIHQ